MNAVEDIGWGLLCVDNAKRLIEEVSVEEANTGLLKTVFENGRLICETSLSEIRETLASK